LSIFACVLPLSSCKRKAHARQAIASVLGWALGMVRRGLEHELN
jgi:hypothetical protein